METGARHAASAQVSNERAPELMPPEVAKEAGAKLDQATPLATPTELFDYGAIMVGAPTRYGRMAAQMANFLDQTGSLGERCPRRQGRRRLASTATQHGGQETTLFSIITNLLHLGLVVVGPYAAAGQMRLDEITGGSPYGATTIAGGKGERQPSANELELVRFQGRHVAEIATRLTR